MAAAPVVRERQVRVRGFDVTVSVREAGEDHEVLGNRLAALASRFVFQRETGAEGFEHYQVRLHRKIKVTLASAIRLDREQLFNGHISVTSNGVHHGPLGQNFNYVMKADTRVAGPWNETDFLYDEPPRMTRQLARFLEMNMYPWQREMEKLLTSGYDSDRGIVVIHDAVGNTGKSIFSEYCEYKGIARELPPFQNLEDLMAAVLAMNQRRGFLVDVPRSLPALGPGAAGFFAGIEALKNGQAFDKRYHFKRVRFDRPHVLVFTNRMPFFGYLSTDRWVLYTVLRDYSLKVLTVASAIKLQEQLDKLAKWKKDGWAAERGPDEEFDPDWDPLAAPSCRPECPCRYIEGWHLYPAPVTPPEAPLGVIEMLMDAAAPVTPPGVAAWDPYQSSSSTDAEIPAPGTPRGDVPWDPYIEGVSLAMPPPVPMECLEEESEGRDEEADAVQLPMLLDSIDWMEAEDLMMAEAAAAAEAAEAAAVWEDDEDPFGHQFMGMDEDL